MKIGRKIRNLILCELLCATLTLVMFSNMPPAPADAAPAQVNATSSSIRDSIVLKAASQLGEHYLWGAEGQVGTVNPSTSMGYTCQGPEIGLGPCTEHRHFDCSGLVYWVLTNCNITIPRLTADAYYMRCYNISSADRAKGNLIFLSESGPAHIHHVGIYCDDNHIYEARGEDYGVVTRTLKNWTDTSENVFFGSLWAVKLECSDDCHTNIKAGDSTLYKITVINEGAVPDTISLETSTPPNGWTATLSNTSVTLMPGGLKTITLNVTTPSNSLWAWSETISVTAKSSADTDGLPNVTKASINTTTAIPGIPIYIIPLAICIIVLALILLWAFKRKRLHTDIPTAKST